MPAGRRAEILDKIGQRLIETEYLAIEERSAHRSRDGILVEAGSFDHGEHPSVGSGRNRWMALDQLHVLFEIHHLLRGRCGGMRSEAQFNEKVVAGLQHVWILPRVRGGRGVSVWWFLCVGGVRQF